MRICMYAYVYVCMCVCMYVYVCMYVCMSVCGGGHTKQIKSGIYYLVSTTVAFTQTVALFL